MKRPTQADVARLAGVSRATVSYVINGLAERGELSITPETRERVNAAIAELGYVPNAPARSLGTGLSQAVGLLLPDTDNPHFWDIARGVQEMVVEKGFTLLLNSGDLNADHESQSLRMLSQQRVDGLILMPTFANDTNTEIVQDIAQLLTRYSPIVFMGTEMPGADSVRSEMYKGALAVMDHLLALGHRRIALIYGVATPSIGKNRLNAYKERLAEAGEIIREDYIIHCTPNLEGGYTSMVTLLNCEPRPTAVVVINDLLAIGAMRAITEHGLHIPDDISVASFDDIAIGRYLPITLTTVSTQAEAVGRKAAELLFTRIAEPQRPTQHIHMPSQLLIRESTGPVPDEA